jgi:uncharacterized protein (TIGR00268 family)
MKRSFICRCPSTSLSTLLKRVERVGIKEQEGYNLIAFSGGVDSSVVAGVVARRFPKNTICVIGKSFSLPKAQFELATKVADLIGVPLQAVNTTEASSLEYLENKGKACYVCKTHLYRALQSVQEYALELQSGKIQIFNGTNKDDLKDSTRIGLIAAKEFNVMSPLDSLTKDEVRSVAAELGLPNNQFAASPCLRSRLAYGIEANSSNLHRVENAEELVRGALCLEPHHNLRVRHLSGGKARIELDSDVLEHSIDLFSELGEKISELGYSAVEFGPFRSGSVSIPMPNIEVKQ